MHKATGAEFCFIYRRSTVLLCRAFSVGLRLKACWYDAIADSLSFAKSDRQNFMPDSTRQVPQGQLEESCQASVEMFRSLIKPERKSRTQPCTSGARSSCKAWCIIGRCTIESDVMGYGNGLSSLSE